MDHGSEDPAPKTKPRGKKSVLRRVLAPLRRRVMWLVWRLLAIMLALVAIFAFINPPTTWTIVTETRAHPGTERVWVPADDIAPVMLRAVVAAEDANFCRHWGFDMTEIRKVIASGSSRGASTLTQQTAKNVFLWQRRSWPRKFLETLWTPMIEALWSKRRIVEVYLNVAEFGPGIMGVGAAARHYFGTTPDKLTAMQAARLAAVLPAPKNRDPRSRAVTRRARSIADGAATIARDGRDICLKP